MRNYLNILACTFLLISCGQTSSETTKQIADLKSELDKSNTKLTELEQKVSEVSMNDIFRRLEKIAYLQIGSTEFSPIDTEVGKLTINIKDVITYANGSKVTLVFGNPSSATVSNTKFKVDYGTLAQDGSIINGSEKSKEITLVQPLNAASWNTVDIVLEGLPVDKLGYLRIHDLSVTSIRLFGKS